MKRLFPLLLISVLFLSVPESVAAITVNDSFGHGTTTAENLYLGGKISLSGVIKPFQCGTNEATYSIKEILISSRNQNGGAPQADLTHAVAKVYINGILVQGTEARAWSGNINITPTNVKEIKNSDKVTFSVTQIAATSPGGIILGVAIEQSNTNMCQSVDGYFTIAQHAPATPTPSPTPNPSLSPVPIATSVPTPTSLAALSSDAPTPTPHTLNTSRKSVLSRFIAAPSSFIHWVRSLFGKR